MVCRLRGLSDSGLWPIKERSGNWSDGAHVPTPVPATVADRRPQLSNQAHHSHRTKCRGCQQGLFEAQDRNFDVHRMTQRMLVCGQISSMLASCLGSKGRAVQSADGLHACYACGMSSRPLFCGGTSGYSRGKLQTPSSLESALRMEEPGFYRTLSALILAITLTDTDTTRHQCAVKDQNRLGDEGRRCDKAHTLHFFALAMILPASRCNNGASDKARLYNLVSVYFHHHHGKAQGGVNRRLDETLERELRVY